MNVCFNIRELRKKSGLTQRELAKMLGFRSTSIVTMWETGDRNPKSEMLPALAAALHCEISDLYITPNDLFCQAVKKDD